MTAVIREEPLETRVKYGVTKLLVQKANLIKLQVYGKDKVGYITRLYGTYIAEKIFQYYGGGGSWCWYLKLVNLQASSYCPNIF